MSLKIILLTAAAMLAGAPAFAKGDLGVKGTKLPELVFGIGDTGYGVSQKAYKVETGKLYELKIKSTGAKECALRAPKFFANVWLRKIEAGGMEIKVPYVHELEYENEGEAEVFFVPIRPGKYELACAGLEERGMSATIIVE